MTEVGRWSVSSGHSLIVLVSSSDFGDKVPHRELSGRAKNLWSIFSRVDPLVLESDELKLQCRLGKRALVNWLVKKDCQKQMQSRSQQMIKSRCRADLSR